MTPPNHKRSRRAAVDRQRLAQSARRFFADISPRRVDHFVRAYGDNLSHRLPLLYTVVLFNIVALAVIFHSTAPRWLWLYVSAATIMAIGARAVYWLPARVRAAIGSTVINPALLTAAERLQYEGYLAAV